MRLAILILTLYFVNSVENKILSQSDYKIQFYDLEDGLSQGSVYTFLKDHLGYMWMTSQEGLNKFDGNQFQIFLDAKNDSSSIHGNNVIGLVQDPYHNIWIGSESCLNKYLYSEDKFEHKYIDSKKTKSDHFPFYADSTEVWYMNEHEGLVAYNYIEDFKEVIDTSFKYKRDYFIIKAAIADHNNNIWIRTGSGITCVNRFSREITIYFNDKNIRCHSVDKHNNIWLEYRSEDELNTTIVKIEGKTRKLIEYKLEVDVGSEILDLISLSEHELWLGTANSGLVLVDLKNNKIIEQIDRNSTGHNTLPTSSVSNLYYDRDSILWASNDPKGVFNVIKDDKPFGLINNFTINGQEIKPGGYRSFFEVNEEEVLVGTEDEGIIKFNPITGKITERLFPSLYNKRHASSLLIDTHNQLWIGSYQGLSIINLNNSKMDPILNPYFQEPGSSTLIWNIIQDESERIYYSTDKGAYAYANGSTYKVPIFQSSPTGLLYIDENNNLFIPAKGTGFATINIDSLWKNQKINNEAEFEFHKSEYTIKSFFKNGDNLWLGTTQGLIHMTQENDINRYRKVEHFDTQDGFPSNVIYGILEDKNHLWLSCNRGLIRFDKSKKELQVYTPADGLQGYEYNTNTFCKLSSGMMLFGGVNGMNFFFPEKIKDLEEEFLPPHISHLKLQNDSIVKILTETDIELSFKHNSFDIHFVSPYFKSTNFSYEYSINDEDWKEANPPISFFELPSGEYHLKIRVKPLISEESNPYSTLNITIQSPWYNKVWFKSTVFFSLFLLTMGLINWRIKSIKEKERFQSRIRSLKLEALQSQMNPHFIFNCLNTVDSFIATNDREQASSYLNNFASLIREALKMTQNETVSLNDELQFIKNYVALERGRLAEPFGVSYDINNESLAEAITIPPFLVQPIVENAIWHGILKMEKNGTLGIKSDCIGNIYNLYIIDNGPGFDMKTALKAESSYAIKIIQERIALHNQTSQTKINFNVNCDHSTIVHFAFNL